MISVYPRPSVVHPSACLKTHRRLAICMLAILFPFSFFLLPCSAQGVITTIAGGGWVFRGDGGPAITAPLAELAGVAVDSTGNVFATDRENHLVVKISPTGVLAVVAGNGIAGFSGDGGPATSASLNTPRSVAVDAAGNLYLADVENHRVRKVNPQGTISTVAGSGTPGFSGDGGPATSASLDQPLDVAVDAANNLYIVDHRNHRIRKVSTAGIISTLAGNGLGGFSGDGGPATSASLAGPYGVAVDAAGNVYLSDAFNSRVRKVNPQGIISTVAASLGAPQGLAVDAAGNLYIAEKNGQSVRKLTPQGTITTVAGNGFQDFSGDGGPATSASLNAPQNVALDAAGNLYIADSEL